MGEQAAKETETPHELVYFVPGEIVVAVESNSDEFDRVISLSTLAAQIGRTINISIARIMRGEDYRISENAGLSTLREAMIAAVALDKTVFVESQGKPVDLPLRQQIPVIPVNDERNKSLGYIKLTLQAQLGESENLLDNRLGLIVAGIDGLLQGWISGLPIGDESVALRPAFRRDLFVQPCELKEARMRAIMPNWLNSGTQKQVGTGGPENNPVSAPPPPPVSLPELQDLPTSETKLPDTHVFVLDTLPAIGTGDPVTGRYDFGLSSTDTAFQDHSLIREMSTGFRQTSAGGMSYYLSGAGNMTLTYINQMTNTNTLSGIQSQRLMADGVTTWTIDEHRHDAADHGVFVAGIVRHIEPRVKIHLIEVLNNKALGTAEMLLYGFARALELMKQYTNANFIINVSIAFACPVYRKSDLSDPVLGNSIPYAFKLLLANSKDSLINVLDRLFPTNKLGISPLIEYFAPQDFRIIAAAGNDSNDSVYSAHIARTAPIEADGRRHMAPRYPAASNGVLGVGAANDDGSLTDYTNTPDAPPTVGLISLGKQVSVLIKGKNGIAPHAPQGFAMWKGSSFACAFVSGALAYYCQEHQLPILLIETSRRRLDGFIKPLP